MRDIEKKNIVRRNQKKRWELMIKIVVDTNIVFSALLNVNSRIDQILIGGSEYFEFNEHTFKFH